MGGQKDEEEKEGSMRWEGKKRRRREHEMGRKEEEKEGSMRWEGKKRRKRAA